MVSAEIIRTIVGIIGNVISLGLFFSPLPTFCKIWKKKDVEQYSPIPYLATFLNCSLWIVYGLPLVHPDSTLVLTINGAGFVIELSYVFIFILYSNGRKRLKVILILLGELGFTVLVAVLVITLIPTTTRRSNVIGVLCVIFCIIMYLAPLSVMKLVIKTKSVEYMPLFLSLASFSNGACWTIYALIRIDPYIIIPNGLGLIFAVAQLVLYAIYYQSTQIQLEARRRGEVGLTEVAVHGDANRFGSAPQNGHATDIREM